MDIVIGKECAIAQQKVGRDTKQKAHIAFCTESCLDNMRVEIFRV